MAKTKIPRSFQKCAVSTLIMRRYQRRQALRIMRAVNETFVLPNPPSWLSTAVKGLNSVISSLRKALNSRVQESVRVSWGE